MTESYSELNSNALCQPNMLQLFLPLVFSFVHTIDMTSHVQMTKTYLAPIFTLQ